MKAYKFLHADGTSLFAGLRWPLPEGGPGRWVTAPARPCRSGVHACRSADLPLWLGRSMYEIELEGDILEQPTKIIASRGRLVRKIQTWDEDAQSEYVQMCADRAHELALSTAPTLDDWDAVVEPSRPEGPALLGFIAARIAERRQGTQAYHSERALQTDWLVHRLTLTD